MANQQLIFADTIAAMKRVINRPDDASESDESISRPTNRGNKLKRKAKYVQEGRLDILNGPRMYKRKIDHAGYSRYIINRNPPRLDEDGDVIEYEDEEEPADAQTAAENPYADIKLEELLAPLTSAADLPTHPSLSVPYKSKSLNEMVDIAKENLHREKATLVRAKLLLTTFRGDQSWAPVGAFHTEMDKALLASHDAEPTVEIEPEENELDQMPTHSASQERGFALEDDAEDGRQGVGAAGSTKVDNQMAEMASIEDRDGEGRTAQPGEVGDTEMKGMDSKVNGDPDAEGAQNAENRAANGDSGADDDDTGSQNTGHRMTTRARANQNSHTPQTPASPSTTASSLPSVHPLYHFPASVIPDPTCGLPPVDAEETRRLLVLFVQKQQEVVRQTDELLNGLMRAERMRSTVLKWAKAEGHVGEMSDGEDWYDKEEWGLTEDLIKGKEEVVEEEDPKEQKKTRGGRRG